MAKMLKQLVLKQKKNPPAPPRPDYEGDKLSDVKPAGQPDDPFIDHDYENFPKFKSKVHFIEKKEPEVVLFDNYSEPADLRAEIFAIEADPLYMSPFDNQGCAPPAEEDMYCLPYEETVTTFAKGCYPNGDHEDAYDVVPDVSDEGPTVDDYYDEPWEWTVGARLTSSLQVSSALSLGNPSDIEEEEEDGMARQRRLYETAFDSRVRRKDADDLDGLAQSPVLLGTPVARAASRSSFGSTSGSSASSTPTHQSMDVVPHRFTPIERRRVTLVRDGATSRSMSPKSDLLRGVVNQNYERKISLAGQWDSLPRNCGSDKSSSQESMNLELSNRSGVSGDDEHRHLTSNYPNNWKELTSAKLENSSGAQKLVQNVVLQKEDSSFSASKKIPPAPSGVKVLPDDPSPRPSRNRLHKAGASVIIDSEHKENNVLIADTAPRRPPSGLLSEASDNVQSPENDHRKPEDYDPPWDLKVGPLNGSVSVPERLSNGNQLQMTTSVTHDKLLEVEKTKDERTSDKPNGSATRPNLNLNLGSAKVMRQKNLTLDFGCSALSVVGEKIDPHVTLEKQGWYHGSISRVEAEAKLRVLKEGSYLVRNSESSKHDYSLSLKSARGFMHMKIVPTSEGRFILGQFSNPFSSIPEMIQHYSLNKLPIKGAEHMSLLYPVIDQLL